MTSLNTSRPSHPDRADCPVEQLRWYANQTLNPAEHAAVAAHLAWCTHCQADLRIWAELRATMQRVRDRTPEPRADLFALIERRLDAPAISATAFGWARLSGVLRTCGHMLEVGGEHVVAQARLIRRDLFWMPLCVVPLVVAMAFLPGWARAADTVALMAALLTAVGMAFLYGQRIDPAHEITLVTSTSPRLILGIRCGVVLGYNLLLNGGIVLPLLAWHGLMTPIWFLSNWFAPLCCLSAIALLFSVVWNASAAVLVCIGLWALRLLDIGQQLLLGDAPPEAFWQRQYEGFWHQGPMLFVVAVLAVILAFCLVERKESFAR